MAKGANIHFILGACQVKTLHFVPKFLLKNNFLFNLYYLKYILYWFFSSIDKKLTTILYDRKVLNFVLYNSNKNIIIFFTLAKKNQIHITSKYRFIQKTGKNSSIS